MLDVQLEKVLTLMSRMPDDSEFARSLQVFVIDTRKSSGHTSYIYEYLCLFSLPRERSLTTLPASSYFFHLIPSSLHEA